MNPFIIGIAGKLGSGKDYISKHTVETVLYKLGIRYLQIAFADVIKINVMTKHNTDYNCLFVKKTKQSRLLLQEEGTRERQNDPDIWIKYMENWITLWKHRGIRVFIITDVRFTNELEWISRHSNKILIKVNAPDRNNIKLLQESNGDIILYNKIKNHSSECDIDNVSTDYFDFIIDNSIDTASSTRLATLEKNLYDILKIHFGSIDL